MCKQIPESATSVVIRLSRMQYMDQTGLYVMEDVLKDLKLKGVSVILVGLLDQPRRMMEKINLIPDCVSPKDMYETFEEYLKKIAK